MDGPWNKLVSTITHVVTATEVIFFKNNNKSAYCYVTEKMQSHLQVSV